jgi:hypothetical protein
VLGGFAVVSLAGGPDPMLAAVMLAWIAPDLRTETGWMRVLLWFCALLLVGNVALLV